jgi:hypothetical protein
MDQHRNEFQHGVQISRNSRAAGSFFTLPESIIFAFGKKTERMLKGILAISGQAGLFKMVTEAKNSIIVESLITGKRMPAYSTARISALSDISVFTETGEIQLKDLFKKFQESEMKVSAKDSVDEIRAFFAEVLPDYDRERVYVSDMKKMLNWYYLLSEKELLHDEPEEEKAEEEKVEEKTNGSESQK